MSLLFNPARIGTMELKNRIIRSATLENMATPDGMPTTETESLYKRLAQGGAGLIVTGYAYVNKAGQCYPLQNGIHTDSVIDKWQKITDNVHEHGSKIAMQIVHGGRQIHQKALGSPKGLAPSKVPNFVYFTVPQVMTEEDIWQTISDFGSAAARVKAAGFDAVQIHAAHGFLIASFLSPLTNRRRDEWGGDSNRRFRFLAKVYRSIRQAVGTDFPILCKLNISDFLGIGLTLKDGFAAAQRLAKHGVDGIEISGGLLENTTRWCRGDTPVDAFCRNRNVFESLMLKLALGLQKPSTRFKEAYFLDYAKELKPTLKCPLILVGGIRRRENAEQILQSGAADFISMSRPLIREPGLPNKWKKGEKETAQCKSCNLCLGGISQGNVLRCYYAKIKKP